MPIARPATRRAQCSAQCVRIPCSFLRRTGARTVASFARQFFEFLFTPRVAEDDFMTGARAKIVPSLAPMSPEPRMPIRISLSVANDR